jgi:uncharacterized protein YkvS
VRTHLRPREYSNVETSKADGELNRLTIGDFAKGLLQNDVSHMATTAVGSVVRFLNMPCPIVEPGNRGRVLVDVTQRNRLYG